MTIRLLSLCITVLLLTSIASAQSWSDRVNAVKQKRLQKKSQTMTVDHPSLKIRQTINHVDLDRISLQDALAWWKQAVGVALLVDWNALEQVGVDPNVPITLKINHAPASVVLDLILEIASQETKIYHYETKWYVQILAREQILKKTEVRMYDVRDLLVRIPKFRNAPKMGLGEALSKSTTTGGSSSSSGGGGGVTLFNETNSNSDEKDNPPTQKDRAQELMDLIRQTIEPDIWLTHGGLHSSITFFKGVLVIRAPEFVHRQIGSSSGSLFGDNRTNGQLDANSQYQLGKATTAANLSSPTSSPGKSKVSSVQSKAASQTVSGVAATLNKD